jgi:uncharacterized membrane protein YoaK (UPF0700 family)
VEVAMSEKKEPKKTGFILISLVLGLGPGVAIGVAIDNLWIGAAIAVGLILLFNILYLRKLKIIARKENESADTADS